MNNIYDFNELFTSYEAYSHVKEEIKKALNENYSFRKNSVTVKIRRREY